MISIKSDREIALMRRAGALTSQARALAGSMVKPGVSTLEIDHAVRDFIRSHGAEPSFLGYSGYPGSACISINEVVIHGIPDHRKLVEGDIVSVDVGAYLDGFHGDCCGTFACGAISPEARRLIDVTRQSFFEGIRMATPGHRVSDISHAVQQYVEQHGYSVVRSFVGHGVGAKLHEPPEVPNFGPAGHGPDCCRAWCWPWSPWSTPAAGRSRSSRTAGPPSPPTAPWPPTTKTPSSSPRASPSS